MSSPPLIDVTGARRRRARQRLKRRLIVVGVILGVLGVVAGGVWLVGWSPVFAAQQVVTEGLTNLEEDEVLTVAEVPLGTPLLRVDSEAVAARVREIPAVADASVRPRFPDTVVIEVTERTVVLVVARAGAYTSIDADGVAFQTSEEIPAGAVLARAQLADEELLAALATVAASLPTGVADEVEYLSADSPDSVTLHLTQGRRVIWGSADESSFKAEVLTPLLTVDATVYNVSAPAHPTTR